MPVFDITHAVTRTDSVWDRSDKRYKNIKEIVNWLGDHVGAYYGTGADHVLEQNDTIRHGTAVLHVGSGWQLERDWRGDPNGYVEVWWRVDITDEAKATLFALTWI